MDKPYLKYVLIVLLFAYQNEINLATPCDISLSQQVNPEDTEFLKNGSLLTSDGVVYSETNYWIDDDTEEIRVCPCNLSPCIFKCCPRGSVLDADEANCTSGDDSAFYSSSGTLYSEEELINITNYPSQFKIIHENPCELGKYMLNPLDYPEDEHYVMENGSLFTISSPSSVFSPNQYCLDLVGNEVMTFRCFLREDDDDPMKLAFIVYPIFMILSLPFLGITFFVYSSIHRLRNIHGKCTMCYSASLFLAYLSLIIAQMGSILRTISDEFCDTLAFIIYFSFLASFFWLNVMCLDIWWTFSGFRPMQGSVKEREHKKFIIYSLYCWGCPLIMLIVAMIMDLHPDVPDDYLKPMFGKSKCWFDNDSATFWYFLGPIAVLIVCNIVLFIFTAIKIMQLKNETKILTRKESKRHDDEESNRQRFNLYLKLFLVMGVNWIMEVVSWAAGGPEYLWYLTDIGNTLQGVLIFIIFVWKDRIRRLLMERFCPKRALSASTKSAVTSTRSITRTSPSRTTTLNTKATVNGNHEEYRMKPLMESSTFESEVP